VSVEVALTCAAIVVARVLDVSLGTIRTVYIVRGRPFVASLLGFVEVLIWIVVASSVIRNLEQPIYMVSYAMGFGLGTYVGMALDARLGDAKQVVRIFSRRGAELASDLRKAGHVVTEFEGRGMEGPISSLFLEVSRRHVRSVLELAEHVDPKCFTVVDDIRESSGTRSRAATLSRRRRFGLRK
jgi:uncharacterized protein YebE (UPF0316 family)